MTEDDIRKAIAWACLTIVAKAPWIDFRSESGGWRIFWSATETEPAIEHDIGLVDWRGLVDLAKGLPCAHAA